MIQASPQTAARLRRINRPVSNPANDVILEKLQERIHGPGSVQEVKADGAINWVSPNEPLGPDWYDSYIGYSPVPDDHPPSLKNPIITKIPTAQDGWKPGASKAARDQALTDLAEIHKRLRRQIGKPEIFFPGSMPSGPQNVANWPIGTGLSSSAAVIERLKRRIKAGGPGSGRHPGYAEKLSEKAEKATTKADRLGGQALQTQNAYDYDSAVASHHAAAKAHGEAATALSHSFGSNEQIDHHTSQERYHRAQEKKFRGITANGIKAYSPDEARDKTGKWTSDPGGEGHTTSHGETMVPAQRDTTGKRSLANGDPLPKFLTKLRIPPAWTGVVVNTNPRGDLMAQGKDVKGRLQSIFSERHTKTASAKKFALIKALEAKADRIQAENTKNHKKDPDHSDAIALIMHTGIRPGSDKDTLADKQAYGATTLLGKHVVQDGDNVSLQFVGKKGVSLNIPITDSHVASMVTARAQTAGPNGKLFGEVTDDSLRDYTHTLDGGKFKPKDFRTLLANKMAVDAMGKVAEPTNLKEYKQAVKTVATAVSQKLGNTPAVALASYINPVVFSSWRGSAHV